MASPGRFRGYQRSRSVHDAERKRTTSRDRGGGRSQMIQEEEQLEDETRNLNFRERDRTKKYENTERRRIAGKDERHRTSARGPSRYEDSRPYSTERSRVTDENARKRILRDGEGEGWTTEDKRQRKARGGGGSQMLEEELDDETRNLNFRERDRAKKYENTERRRMAGMDERHRTSARGPSRYGDSRPYSTERSRVTEENARNRILRDGEGERWTTEDERQSKARGFERNQHETRGHKREINVEGDASEMTATSKRQRLSQAGHKRNAVDSQTRSNGKKQPEYQSKHTSISKPCQVVSCLGQSMPESTMRNLEEQEPEMILLTLLLQEKRFNNLLSTNDLNIRTIQLILKVVDKALTTKHMPVDVSRLLRILTDNHFFEKHVWKYLSSDDNERKGCENDLLNIISISTKTLQHLPRLCAISATPTISQLQQIISNSGTESSTKGKFDELLDIHTNIVQKMQSSPLEDDSADITDDDGSEPPDDFRTINIIPNKEDLFNEGKTFLRKNKADGSYESAHQYLDVHFRLLREDFVAPLRDGIHAYLRMQTDKAKHIKLADIRVYSGVHIELPKLTRAGTVYPVKFDVAHLKKVRWESGKRLKFGSLICLSDDDFKTLTFGTVAEGKPEDLRQGRMSIKFEDSSHHLTFNAEYVMVESSTYFEAYSYVLKGLQEMADHELPFNNYLLRCDTTVPPPKYLHYSRCNYDFRGLIEPRSGDDRSVNVLNTDAWPSREKLGLDVYQYKALKTAITKEFAIIQGPPGTGKTFLGLKIMQLLLDNAHQWNDDDSPILVVCYTNHALDQFLEGLLRSTCLKPDRLLRFGSRSQSKVLQECNIRRQKQSSPHIFRNKKECINEMEHIKAIVDNQISQFKSTQSGIFHEGYLKRVMTPLHYASLMGRNTWNESVLFFWLLHDICFQLPRDTSSTSAERETRWNDLDRSQNAKSLHQVETDLTRHDKSVLIYHLSEHKEDIMSEKEEKVCSNLWSLDATRRWHLYKMWLSRLNKEFLLRIQMYLHKYDQLAGELRELKELADINMAQGALVIGMTTTCAAKNRRLLQRIQPNIVIVEEAAEVFESHIVTTLPENCQHLILIGDHQQLRPNPAVYKLAKNYNLDISLFERMAKNSTHCDKLLVQHRMRPEIARLIVPHVYKVLHNHPSVEKYENVKGVQGNLFFIDHHETETAVIHTTGSTKIMCVRNHV